MFDFLRKHSKLSMVIVSHGVNLYGHRDPEKHLQLPGEIYFLIYKLNALVNENDFRLFTILKLLPILFIQMKYKFSLK
jgi:hypothetical protein